MNYTKMLAVGIATIMALSPANAFAASIGSEVADGNTQTGETAETVIGSDPSRNAKTVYGVEEVGDESTSDFTVYAYKDQASEVLLPKTLIMDGASAKTNKCQYIVGVKGDISGDETVEVVPDKNVTLTSKGKKDVVTANISQEKTSFVSNEINADTWTTSVGNVATDPDTTGNSLTAGQWNGTFNFNVSLLSYYTATIADFDSYEIEGNSVRLNKYIGDEVNVLIPSTMTIDSTTYKSTIWQSFFDNTTVENVYIDGADAWGDVGQSMFQGATNLKTIKGYFGNQSSITQLNSTCENCTSLKSFDIDLSTMTSLNVMGNTFANDELLSTKLVFPKGYANLGSALKHCYSVNYIELSGDSDNIDINNALTYDRNNKPITVKCDADTNVYTALVSFKSQIDAMAYLFNITIIADDTQSSAKTISCFGDSVTSSGYPYQMYQLNKEDICLNNGVAGETTSQIAYRSGAWKIRTNSFVIPSSNTSKVTVKLIGDHNGERLPVASVACSISGIEGRLTYDSSADKYYFQRNNNGIQANVEDGTVVEMDNDVSKLNASDVLVIHAGTNDYNETISNISNVDMINSVNSIIDDIIDYSGTTIYIVCGVTMAARYNAETSSVYEQVMSEKYGEHFINTRQYYIDNAYTFLGRIPDETATNEMAVGQVPQELFSDGLHPNEDGQKVLAKMVLDKIQNM